jgi:hypothetical protein
MRKPFLKNEIEGIFWLIFVETGLCFFLQGPVRINIAKILKIRKMKLGYQKTHLYNWLLVSRG